ncbi:alanine racemase [Novosphingobium sp. TH158]|uniref:alanine racemase n=1 Tax=Novosphingobium sp. TH158 TaxID=2067455 RepID=UPI000C7C8090|nr:alanine racemase [Novosphingobium sp. TH158]PLK25885.1 alanine racemase [Novosphingobium sp. TH158]
MTPKPPLRLHLDTDALVHNWRALDALSGKARAGAAVKADAYGLGAPRVVKALAAAGCRDFFVAYAGEAAQIDGLVDPAQISVLHGPLTADEARFMQARGIRPTINSIEQAQCWLDTGGGACDLMVDTGMNRLGLALSDLGDDLVARLDVEVLLSHLASADEDSPLNAQQRARWIEARAMVPSRGCSLANSAGIVLGEGYHGTLTRPGLSLYGGVPRAELAGTIRQVAYPQATIIQAREVSAGDTIGYNATFTASRAMRIGVVALGYADGYLRCWSGKGMLRSNGTPLPVVGRVSMDMTLIDISAAPHIRAGDWVEADYALPEAAQACGLSQYELLTSLGRRFCR